MFTPEGSGSLRSTKPVPLRRTRQISRRLLKHYAVVSGRMMSIAELADLLQIPRSKVYKHLKRELRRGLPAVRVGGRWQVDFDELVEWMCDLEEALETNGPGRRRLKG